MRDPFDGSTLRGQFAGHETFPLRLLWLKKAYDAVGPKGAPISVFKDPAAIVSLGVGKNMAVSMRHWALATQCLEESDRKLVPTSMGQAILSDSGYDPYLERPETLWLMHWQLASKPAPASTIFYAFNAIAAGEFEIVTLQKQLADSITRQGWRVSEVTLRRDIEVFLRSYAPRIQPDIEDAAEPLLAELGLLRTLGSGGWFEFVRGPKPSLSDGVFGYALLKFWERTHANLSTLSVEQICYDAGSPGRVFKLDEDSVVTRLLRMETLTGGSWRWTDTAGLRQIQKISKPDPARLIAKAYRATRADL